jgi:hypothetical protein
LFIRPRQHDGIVERGWPVQCNINVEGLLKSCEE